MLVTKNTPQPWCIYRFIHGCTCNHNAQRYPTCLLLKRKEHPVVVCLFLLPHAAFRACFVQRLRFRCFCLFRTPVLCLQRREKILPPGFPSLSCYSPTPPANDACCLPWARRRASARTRTRLPGSPPPLIVKEKCQYCMVKQSWDLGNAILTSLRNARPPRRAARRSPRSWFVFAETCASLCRSRHTRLRLRPRPRSAAFDTPRLRFRW